MKQESSFNSTFIKAALFPFAGLYHLGTAFRNHLFNIHYFRSFNFNIPTINVGNLTVGGTGKTPHIEYLVRLLKDRYKVATLSRGYGRKTRGIIIADKQANPEQIGDEPMQFHSKFSDSITVAVGEERALAIPTIIYEKPETDVILLDDAFQHRAVSPDLNILLSDYNRPFYEDFILPAGRLRESRNGAARADVVIVTKCPDDLTKSTSLGIENKIRKYTKPNCPIFFTRVKYQNPLPVFDDFKGTISKNIILFTGIASSAIIKDRIRTEGTLLYSFDYGDHHNYEEKDILEILNYYKGHKSNCCLLTTEKDMVKIKNERFKDLLKNVPVFYLPIEISFLFNQEKFDSIVNATISNKSKA